MNTLYYPFTIIFEISTKGSIDAAPTLAANFSPHLVAALNPAQCAGCGTADFAHDLTISSGYESDIWDNQGNHSQTDVLI